MHRALQTAWLAAVVFVATGLARAAEPAGTVTSLQGKAEAQHQGQAAWGALATGVDVFVGDRVRTGEASRVKLLMRDDSVITIGARSELVIDTQVVKAEQSTSRFDAVVGSVRAVVTDRYGTKGSSFEVRTPTAVAGVRGTGFVALVDEDGKRTRVIGLYDTTFVRSVRDPAGRREVRVGPGELTEIVAGGMPSPARALSATELEALTAPTTIPPGSPGGPPPGGGSDGTGPAEQGSGDPGDPATPQPPGGGSLRRPDGVIDQPIDRLRQPRSPSPPPPRR